VLKGYLEAFGGLAYFCSLVFWFAHLKATLFF
jgi:hypothetical protein